MHTARPKADSRHILSGNAARIDRRVARTRSALLQAFAHLLLVARRRRREITVGAIVEQANVGRSTFYEHFASADALLLEALRTPLAAYADAAAGTGDPQQVATVLAHFWENRTSVRELLGGRMDARVGQLLAEMIAERLDDAGFVATVPMPIAAGQLAAAALAPLRGWMRAAAPCTPETLAASLCRTGEALAAALRDRGEREAQ